MRGAERVYVLSSGWRSLLRGRATVPVGRTPAPIARSGFAPPPAPARRPAFRRRVTLRSVCSSQGDTRPASQPLREMEERKNADGLWAPSTRRSASQLINQSRAMSWRRQVDTLARQYVWRGGVIWRFAPTAARNQTSRRLDPWSISADEFLISCSALTARAAPLRSGSKHRCPTAQPATISSRAELELLSLALRNLQSSREPPLKVTRRVPEPSSVWMKIETQDRESDSGSSSTRQACE